MMKHAKVLDKNIDTKRLDLLYVAESKHKQQITFDQFLNLIPKIARVKYPSPIHQPSEAFSLLINENLLPLHQLVLENTDLG